MFRKHPPIILLFFILCVLFSVSKIKAQPDEIETLVREVSADTQKGAVFGYTYQMRFSYNRRGKFGAGRRFSRLYEAIIPNRFSLKKTYGHPLLLIQDSEKVITQYDVEFMRNKLVEEIERAEQEAAVEKLESVNRKDGGYWTISFRAGDKGVMIDIVKILETAKLSNLQRSENGGRKIVSIDFHPDPEAKFETALSYLNKIEGRIWIDEADRRIMKVEGFPLGMLEANKDKPDEVRLPETVFLFAQTRVAEGFWFPQTVVVDFTKNPEIFETVRVEFSFDKYRKSSTEVRSSAVEPPKDAETEEKTDNKKDEKQRKDQ